jgi:dihydrofolate synthase/folylpolyglutamate synthase
MSLEQLASLAKDANLKGDAYPTVKEAVKEARLAAAPEDFIYIGGSTFIVADFLASE